MTKESIRKKQYNDKAYDKFFIQLPKGTKDVIDRLLDEKKDDLLINNSSKFASKTTYIFSAMCREYEEDTGKSLIEEIKKIRGQNKS